jgi:hypothetical protein
MKPWVRVYFSLNERECVSFICVFIENSFGKFSFWLIITFHRPFCVEISPLLSSFILSNLIAP